MNNSKFIDRIGWPRLIIAAFLVLLLILAQISGLGVQGLISDTFRRYGQYGVLVLAMVPGVQCGIGLNFGISLGIVGGLLGALISMELGPEFWMGMGAPEKLIPLFTILLALVIGAAFASVIGIGYGILLNRVKGSEMTVSTYVGFSIIAFMNIAWLILPFKRGDLIWTIGGSGLRTTLTLENSFGNVFNRFLAFKIPHTEIEIPTGLWLFFFGACFLVWLFLRSKVGMAMSAAGSNPAFARANGINVDKMRILGTAISTAIGAVGIIVYAQSYGFVQLYNAPMMMGFSCVASVLIGGASIRRANISNVLIGTLLFQGLLTLGLPVANRIIPVANLSEVMRLIISNGIILYALTKSGGGKNA
ncbi:MAG: ABC transporter permease [Clostridia bacterium]|nr:ABC transporter permease [Clostridia bacterium]